MSIHWAERYIGIPWLTGGRVKRLGLDCWGLLRHIYAQEFHIELSYHAAPLGTIAPALLVEAAELNSPLWQPTNEPQDGDGVALGRDGQFSHVGVYVQLERPYMLHTARKELSTIIPIIRLAEMGWNTVRFYRHADRTPHH